MNKRDDDGLKSLRERAEAALSAGCIRDGSFSAEDSRTLIHDLQVHQIELEMQNDELRSSRNELELARDGYARLYNQSPVGYLSLDESGIIRKANQTFLDMLGADDTAVKGQPFSELLETADRDVFLGRFGAVFRRPEGKSLELRIKAKGRNLSVRLSARREQQGKTLLVIVNDISEQVKAQEDLRDAERLWSETFEAMGDAVWILDGDGKILKYNSASERLLGRPIDKLRTCFCFEEMHDSLNRISDCPYLRMKDSLARETHVFRSGERWFEVSVEPLRNGNGRIIGTVHITKDITERKNADDRIRALLEEKHLLLKEVHHRIKNNMNVATAFLSLQADRIQNPEAVAALEDAQRRMLSMMIIYDRLYRSADFRNISTAEYLSQLLEAVAAQFEAPGIRLDREIEDFLVDSTVLYPVGIILNELITNSFKYAFPAGRKGTITTRLKREDDSTALLSIRDDGIGLPPDFDPGRSEGFGFVLVGALVGQVGGSLSLIRDGGAGFDVRFPVGEKPV